MAGASKVPIGTGDRVAAEDDGDAMEEVDLSSEALGLFGKVDCLRRRDGVALPYEHKRGRCRREEDKTPAAWPSDRVQVAAYGLMLEEATGKRVPEGRIRYHKDGVTVRIPLDEAARADVRAAVARARELRGTLDRPPVTENERLCRRCSLAPVCLPEEVRQDHDPEHAAVRLFPPDDQRTSLHVMSEAATVGSSGDRLVVRPREGPESKHASHEVAAVLLHSGNQITTQAIALCVDRDIAVHWVSGGGRHVASLASSVGQVQRRVRQYQALADIPTRLRLAKQLVRAKVEGQHRYLLRATRGAENLHDRNAIRPDLIAISGSLASIHSAADVDILRGHEGDAAVHYFAGLRAAVSGDVPEALRYAGRSRRPTLDRFSTHTFTLDRTLTTALASGSTYSLTPVALVASESYDAAGRVQDQTDPKGIVTRTAHDLLGRVTSTDAGYVDGVPSNADDQITRYTYDGDDHTLTMTADMPSAQHDQITKYVYGVTTGGGSTLNSNDLLKETDYPDKSTGAAGTNASDKEQYAYDAAGDVLTFLDQNGTLHTYTYDVLGRETADAVTVASGNPKNVDTSILRHETAYNTQGLPYLYTSYNAASGGTVVNQVQDVFNGLGQLTTEYQAVSGSVNTSTSPKVQYAYVEMASGANNSRLLSMTYPNGRVLHYAYNSGVDDTISRLSYMADDNGSGGIGTHLEEYSYLGLDTIVREVHPENGTELTYIKQSGESNGDAGDQYNGIDRFGRVVDQRYLVTSSGTATDRFQYGYDKDGNPLYKNNLLSSANSELYHANSTTGGDDATGYDLLGRLTAFRRGTLSSSGNNGSSLDTVTTASDTQSWNLDAIGNQASVVTNGTTVSNTHNDGNELTVNNGNSLAFDSDGNTTTDESGKTYTYDAWNHQIVAKTSGGTTLETYAYDALGRRTTEAPASGFATIIYYGGQDNWQALEEQKNAVTTTQYVWSQSYINDLVVRDTDADSNSGTGSYGKSGSGLEQRLYIDHDANHNVTSLLNTSGAVQERLIYLPYGKATVVNASTWASTTDTFNWTYRFQGGRWDTLTDGVYFEHRIYDLNTETWKTEDPAGYVDGANRYVYMKNGPAAGVDPMGMERIASFDSYGSNPGSLSIWVPIDHLSGMLSVEWEIKKGSVPIRSPVADTILESDARAPNTFKSTAGGLTSIFQHRAGSKVSFSFVSASATCLPAKLEWRQRVRILVPRGLTNKDPEYVAGIVRHESAEHNGKNPVVEDSPNLSPSAGWVGDNPLGDENAPLTGSASGKMEDGPNLPRDEQVPTMKEGFRGQPQTTTTAPIYMDNDLIFRKELISELFYNGKSTGIKINWSVTMNPARPDFGHIQGTINVPDGQALGPPLP